MQLCAVETGLHHYLHYLLIMKSWLHQQLNLKFHHPIVFSQSSVPGVAAALVIPASAKAPAQPTG
jgi:hypothetical protein